uniref:Uncharacterized protein n=1 Tax=Avena sativa TaxID=4498 RepID=A0ACD5X9S9_AVESA
MKLLPCCSAIEVLDEILNLQEKERLLTVALLWSWWYERNKGNHGEARMSVEGFQFAVRRHVDEWSSLLKKQAQIGLPSVSKWEVPPSGFIKLNIDAAFNEETRSGGWGVIGRDESADICVAAAGPLQHMSDAMHAEATAMSHAMQLVERMGMGRVIFETDCLNLKHAMTTSDYSLSLIGNLFSDMKFRLHMCFIEARVVFVPRACNRPAHVLAAKGVGEVQENHVVWTSDFPTDVTRLVTGERAVS